MVKAMIACVRPNWKLGSFFMVCTSTADVPETKTTIDINMGIPQPIAVKTGRSFSTEARFLVRKK